jgi:uncharacterized protein (DUF885 family)
VDIAIANMRQGLAAGVVQPRILMERTNDEIRPVEAFRERSRWVAARRLLSEHLRSAVPPGGAELGARFDIKVFHRQILQDGALPLDVLEAKIDRWIVSQRP